MKECWVIYLLAVITEVIIATWRWGHSPTHRLRDWYEGSFQSYFIDNVGPWVIVFTVLTAMWLLVAKRRKRESKV
jgi:hypothetical protein